MGTQREATRRHWVTLLVIVASLYALAFAIWSPPAAAGPEAGAEARDVGAWWWIQVVGGGLGLASVLVALRRATLARGMLAVAGVVLILGVFTFGELSWVPLVTLALPGAAMLLAAPFMGAMPTPEDEGKPRTQSGHAPRGDAAPPGR